MARWQLISPVPVEQPTLGRTWEPGEIKTLGEDDTDVPEGAVRLEDAPGEPIEQVPAPEPGEEQDR